MFPPNRYIIYQKLSIVKSLTMLFLLLPFFDYRKRHNFQYKSSILNAVIIMILYADVYIIINALCDWLALWSCGAILSLKTERLRLLGGAFFMAGYSLAAVVCGLGGALSVVFNIAALAIGCLIAYEVVSFAHFLKIAAVFFVCCLTIGGIAGWIFGLSHSRLIIIVCLTPLIYFTWLYISEASCKNMRIKKISVTIDGASLIGIADSGNLLVEPQSGLEVIIANRRAAEALLPSEMSLIEVKTAAGTDLLPYFVPEKIQIGRKKVRAAVAINEKNELEFDCIVPISLAD